MKFNMEYFIGLFKKKETEGQKYALLLIDNLEKEIKRTSENNLKELQIKKELSKTLRFSYFLNLGDKSVYDNKLLQEEIESNFKEMIKIIETEVMSLEFKELKTDIDEDGESIQIKLDMNINLKN